MHNCNETRSMFVDALYGNLNGDQLQQFQAELKQCKRCRIAYRKMKATLQIADSHKRQDPGEEFWNQYWDRLQNRMASQALKIQAPPRVLWYQRYAWAARIAAVLVLVGLGVILGRLTFSPTPEPPITTVQTPSPSAATTVSASVDRRAQRFINRSEVLLLALVNFDPENEDPASLNFDRQQEVSQDLIQEATFLKTNLNAPKQRRVHQLVTDLEVILLQIAHLEAQEDLPEIELVKTGVDRKGLLLKINMEQMRAASSLDLKEPGI